MAKPFESPDEFRVELESLQKHNKELEASLSKYKRRYRKAAGKLKDHGYQFSYLYENAALPYQSLDINGNILQVNTAWLGLMGYSGDEVIGKSFGDFCAPESLQYFYTCFPKFKAEGEITDIEMKLMKKDGSTLYVSFNGKADYDERGKFRQAHCLMLDVTGNKQAEQKLIESEEKYRLLTESSPTGIAIQQDEKYVYVNAKFTEMHGYKPDEMLGMEHWRFIHPDNIEIARENVRKLTSGEITQLASLGKRLRKDGQIIWVEQMATHIQYRGKPAVMGNFIDITDRVKANEELTLRALLLDSANDSISAYEFDTGVFVYANEMTYKSRGYSKDELMNMKFFQIVTPENMEVIEGRRQNLLQTRGHTFESAHLCKDGSIIPVEVRSRLIERDGKKYVLTIARDITERKIIEEELKLRAHLLDNVNDAIYLYDLDGNFLYMNKIMCTIHGYSHDELMEMKLSQLLTPENAQGFGQRRKILLEKGSNTFEVEQFRKDGSVIPLEIHSMIIVIEGEKLIVSIARDIKERKHMEEEMLRSQKLDSIGVLAGGIAHDFNNILTGIMGNIGIARMETKPETEMEQRLSEAEKACLRAKDLTQQLLTFARGGAPIKKETAIAGLLKETITFALRGSRSVPEFSLPDDLWSLEVDEGQLSQVINNLAINAQQAMPNGGTIRVMAENTVISSQQGNSLKEGNYIKITIADQGIGIPREHLEKIFDPYFTTKATGRGLGLATSYSIIKNHGGLISVASELGVGTTFTIYVPALGHKAQIASPEKDRQPVCVKKGRILVMDDEAVIRDVASRMLQHLGCEEIVLTKDGAEAIAKYQEALNSGNRFDAVIMDLTIPGGMGGKEAIEQLLQLDPEIKAIVSSGYANDPIMAEYKKYGFSAVVTKPYNLGDLSKALDEVLRRKEK